MNSPCTLACKHCSHEVDPNDKDLNLHPPTSKNSVSLMSIECPACHKTEDFHAWRIKTKSPRPAAS
jgi:hypothetical protein